MYRRGPVFRFYPYLASFGRDRWTLEEEDSRAKTRVVQWVFHFFHSLALLGCSHTFYGLDSLSGGVRLA
jgi:hypothetical protein